MTRRKETTARMPKPRSPRREKTLLPAPSPRTAKTNHLAIKAPSVTANRMPPSLGSGLQDRHFIPWQQFARTRGLSGRLPRPHRVNYRQVRLFLIAFPARSGRVLVLSRGADVGKEPRAKGQADKSFR